MPIAAFFVVFAGSIVLAVLYPHIRAVAIMIGLVCTAILVFIVVDRGSTPERQRAVIAVQELRLSDVEFSETSRFTRLSGRVQNTSSAHQLREFSILATLYDCPDTEVALPSCEVIAQDEGIARVDVPPGQTRAFEAILGLTQRLSPKGDARWDFDILSTRATAPVP
ncbi:MAG: hypothetical protein AAF848_04215 [Pseudomonadota bacterium]